MHGLQSYCYPVRRNPALRTECASGVDSAAAHRCNVVALLQAMLVPIKQMFGHAGLNGSVAYGACLSFSKLAVLHEALYASYLKTMCGLLIACIAMVCLLSWASQGSNCFGRSSRCTA